jgi:hypothetical protein
LLKNPTDQEIFDYYATSQVAVIGMDGTSVAIGKPGVIEEATASPDGRYALISAQHKPYSYLLPYEMFPLRVSVVDLSTGSVKELSDRALQDSVPNIHDAVFAGPREYQWRSDAPATVFWVEAGDGGDPRKEAAVRDTLYLLDAPFTGGARKLAELPIRFRSVTWSEKHTVLVEERRWKDRARVILAVSVGGAGEAVRGIVRGSVQRSGDGGQRDEWRGETGGGDDAGWQWSVLARRGSIGGRRQALRGGDESREWEFEENLGVGEGIFRISVGCDRCWPGEGAGAEGIADAESELLLVERGASAAAGDGVPESVRECDVADQAGAEVQARGRGGAERKSLFAGWV